MGLVNVYQQDNPVSFVIGVGGVASNNCANGHMFMWSGSTPNVEVPEGLPCLCGGVISSYEKCPCCGHRKLIYIPKGYFKNEG